MPKTAKVVVELSAEEALVLFEWLAGVEDGPAPSPPVGSTSQQTVLRAVEDQLEKQLVASLDSSGLERLDDARKRARSFGAAPPTAHSTERAAVTPAPEGAAPAGASLSDSARAFAVGPFASLGTLEVLELDPPLGIYRAGDSVGANRHFAVETPHGVFVCAFDRAVRDGGFAILPGDGWVITVDCWNSYTEGATIARFKIDRHDGDELDTTWTDRRDTKLAEPAAIGGVTADWLAQKIHDLVRPV